jgi:hypothetical protein
MSGCADKVTAARLMSGTDNNQVMFNGINAPVLAGLAVGIAFIVFLAILVSPLTVFHPNVKLKDEWDQDGQQKAIDVLLTDLNVRTFVAGKNFEVWAYGADFPQESIQEGICDKDECTLIGIRERNADDSVDCHLKTFVNVETRQVDTVFYTSRCDQVRR